MAVKAYKKPKRRHLRQAQGIRPNEQNRGRVQAEDYRHIFMAEKSIEFLAKKLNIDLGKEMNKLNSKKPKH